MNEICKFAVRNGAVTEYYAVERDHGDLFIHCSYGEDGPTDTMHIADAAAVRVATAMLLAVGIGRRESIPVGFPAANVVSFPMMGVVR